MTAAVRHLFTAAEAERILGIPAGTIRSWAVDRPARPQRIWSYGLDQHGRPMYDRDDLIRERDKHKQPA
jgi:hypothetical protein